MQFRQMAWQTDTTMPTAEFRQGRILSPVVFRWVLDDVLSTLRVRWESRDMGVAVGPGPLLYRAWADPTLLAAHHTQSGRNLCTDLRSNEAAKKANLEFTCAKCGWSEVRRQGQPPTPVPEAHQELGTMAQSDMTATIRVLGSGVRMQANYELEFTQVLANVLAASHTKAPLWRTRGSLHAKLRVLRLSTNVSFARASGT